jgi:hypothetical protein
MSSRMLSRVVLAKHKISEETIATVTKLTINGEVGTNLAVTSNRSAFV